MTAYYNEIDPYAAQWLRNLISAGHIAPGDVDERDIRDVTADDIKGYAQCHFFAGIAGWSQALRLAGWDDERSVWTGSCPCQPFSAAGKGASANDERHLWPAWASLIKECRPRTIFGEQVEAAIGWGWLDLVFDDLEAEEYACASAVLPACSVGAPHIRNRIWFVADAATSGRRQISANTGGFASGDQAEGFAAGFVSGSAIGELADADGGNASAERLQRSGQHRQFAQDSGAGELDDSECDGRSRIWQPQHANEQGTYGLQPDRSGTRGFWEGAIWLPCRDGKARPVMPKIQPLAHGTTARMGKLRAAGNAIVAPLAAQFIEAVM